MPTPLDSVGSLIWRVTERVYSSPPPAAAVAAATAEAVMTVRLRPDSEMLATSGTPVRLMPAVELSSSVRFSACNVVRTPGLSQLCCAGCRGTSTVVSRNQPLRVCDWMESDAQPSMTVWRVSHSVLLLHV
jgi:hypothetical protein